MILDDVFNLAATVRNPDEFRQEFAAPHFPDSFDTGELLMGLCARVESTDPDRIIAKSKETDTHFVWCVQSLRESDGKICIHQYKNLPTGLGGHANTVHDHRYDFLTFMLQGSYSEERYSPESVLGDHSPAVVRKSSFTPGSIRFVPNELFHRVTDVEPGTLTLVLKAPASKENSTSLDLKTGIRQNHLSWKQRFHAFATALGAPHVESDKPS